MIKAEEEDVPKHQLTNYKPRPRNIPEEQRHNYTAVEA